MEIIKLIFNSIVGLILVYLVGKILGKLDQITSMSVKISFMWDEHIKRHPEQKHLYELAIKAIQKGKSDE